jgi:hypothetical protein
MLMLPPELVEYQQHFYKLGEDMTKIRPDKTIVHRIELQQKERELLEGALLAYTVNRVSTPAVALLSDVSGMIAIGGILGAIGIYIDMNGLNSESSMGDVISRYKEGYAQYNRNKQAQNINEAQSSGNQSVLGGVEGIIRQLFGIIIDRPDVEFNP